MRIHLRRILKGTIFHKSLQGADPQDICSPARAGLQQMLHRDADSEPHLAGPRPPRARPDSSGENRYGNATCKLRARLASHSVGGCSERNSLISALTTSSTSEGGSTGFCKLSELAVISLPTRGETETMVVRLGPRRVLSSSIINIVHGVAFCQLAAPSLREAQFFFPHVSLSSTRLPILDFYGIDPLCTTRLAARRLWNGTAPREVWPYDARNTSPL